MAVMDSPEQRWHDVAVRLVADTHLLDERLAGGRAPHVSAGAHVVEAGRLLVGRLVRVAEQIDATHHAQLPPAVVDQLRVAAAQLRAAHEALTSLPQALDPHYR
jgi:hypothetical protein